MNTFPIQLERPAKTSRRSAARRRFARKGTMWLMFLFIMLIAFASLAFAVNWTYGLLLTRNQQRLSDLLALGGVEHLLDEGLLADDPVVDAATNQSDDVLETEEALLDPTTGLLTLNNQVHAAAFRPTAANVRMRVGRIEDATINPNQEIAPGVPNFTNSGTGPLYNALWIEIYRPPTAMQRVFPLIRGIVRDRDYQLSLGSSSFAMLDSRVVGFRPFESAAYPESNKTAPLLPLAVSRQAWFNTRPSLGDSNSNGRRELWLELKDVPADTANGALISFDVALPIDESDLTNQIQTGMRRALVTTGTFGPVHPSVTYSVQATEQSPTNLAAVQNALASILNAPSAKRVLPIFNTFSNPLAIEGFVGAEILAVDATASRLRVLVEPAFVLHSTVVTEQTVSDGVSTFAVDDNPYVHKIRLTQ